ncbi:MAG: NmrA family NAD(P)-binding protein [Gluconacetobacter diazotrophicus]|nr:NmrA family NAD(P)-binding protein [Gluconacetobacter diazotrophicus]
MPTTLVAEGTSPYGPAPVRAQQRAPGPGPRRNPGRRSGVGCTVPPPAIPFPRIVVAGATGDLGRRVAAALAVRGATVLALHRPGTDPARPSLLRDASAVPVPVALSDRAALEAVLRGAAGVVSTLNGLEPTVIGAQEALLDAAVAAGVPRFVPSDFSLDFTRTRPGDNRNLDLRRRFALRLDAAPVRATSILNGGFLDLLSGQAPILARRARRVLHFGDPDQPLDFTARDDVAAFTADAVLDPDAPRILRIAGDSPSPVDLAHLMSELSGRPWRPLRLGSIPAMGVLIATLRTLTPRTDAPFPIWQGLQYLRDMMSGRGRLHPLDNARYGRTRWSTVRDLFAPSAAAPD